MKSRPYGKNGVVGTRHMTHDTEDKEEEQFVLVFTGMMLVFVAKHHGDQVAQSAGGGKTVYCRMKCVLFPLPLQHVLTHLHVWCHDNLHLVLTFQACHVKITDLLW